MVRESVNECLLIFLGQFLVIFVAGCNVRWSSNE